MRGMIKNKSGQSIMGLPFGIIFSIILIVVFIMAAFFAINHFLEISKCTQVGEFYDDLQKNVNDAMASGGSEFTFKTSLPSGIQKICFANLSAPITGDKEDYEAMKNYDVYDANTFLLPSGKTCGMQYKLIQRINVSEITKMKNPYCVDVARDLVIKKEIYGKYVIIK